MGAPDRGNPIKVKPSNIERSAHAIFEPCHLAPGYATRAA